MKLVVLGATGGTGIEIVKQAIERGHSVTALVRSPDRLKAFRDRIAIRKGDLLNSLDLGKSIQGSRRRALGFRPAGTRIEGRRTPSPAVRCGPDWRHPSRRSPS